MTIMVEKAVGEVFGANFLLCGFKSLMLEGFMCTCSMSHSCSLASDWCNVDIRMLYGTDIWQYVIFKNIRGSTKSSSNRSEAYLLHTRQCLLGTSMLCVLTSTAGSHVLPFLSALPAQSPALLSPHSTPVYSVPYFSLI